MDLKKIHDYLLEVRKQKSEMNESQDENMNLEESEQKLLKILNTLYANCRFQVLQYMKRPFIFGYSAMVNK